MTDIEQRISVELDGVNQEAQTPTFEISPEIMEIIKNNRLDLSEFDGLTDDEL